MKYQKIINLFHNTSNQSPKFRTKNWNEVNDNLNGTYSVNSSLKFETFIIRSSLCNHNDAYIIAKGTMTVPNIGTTAVPNNRNKKCND